MSLDSLHKRIDALIEQIEQQQEQGPSYSVVIYDPETGEPLPGYERAASRAAILIPDNGRDSYATFWLPAVKHDQEYTA